MGLSNALLLDPYPFEIWIAQRSDALKGSGTLNDPYDGSTATKFDAVMNGLPGPTLVHLGPGTFETNGYSDDVSGGWQIRPGMRIVGSGMQATTLKLVNATTANAHYFAIGHKLTTGTPAVPNPMDFCEVADLTIDCNLPALPTTVACGAVRLMGNHVKLHRVRAIKWGTTSSSKPCFVFAALTADRTAGVFEAANCGIDRCVAELPASNGTSAAITVLHVGGKEDAATNAEAYGRACYIRNSFVDASPLALTAEVRALSMGWCHAGIIEGNQLHNVRIGGPYQDKATTREIIVRNNFYRNVVRGPYWKLGLNATVGTRPITLSKVSSNPLTAEATLTDHSFQAGDRVKIDGTVGTGNENAAAYKGVFVISSVPSTNAFQYVMISDPVTHVLTSPTAQKVFGVSNLVVERNIIELAQGSSAEHAIHVDDGKTDIDTTVDTPHHVHTEVIVRENRIRYMDVKFDLTWTGEGVRVSGAKNVIVRDNIVELAPINPLKNFRCGTVKYFNNKSPSGALLQGLNGITNQKYRERETESEDALILTLI